jgi:hypothetical protein
VTTRHLRDLERLLTVTAEGAGATLESIKQTNRNHLRITIVRADASSFYLTTGLTPGNQWTALHKTAAQARRMLRGIAA